MKTSNYTTTHDTAKDTTYLCSTYRKDCNIVIDRSKNRLYLMYFGKVERRDADSIGLVEFTKMVHSFFNEVERLEQGGWFYGNK